MGKQIKTIRQRAESYARTVEKIGRNPQNPNYFARKDFIAGAVSERKHLLTWINPKKELPENGKEVLLKVLFKVDKEIGYKLGMVISGQLRIANQREDCEILGWRDICELKEQEKSCNF